MTEAARRAAVQLVAAEFGVSPTAVDALCDLVADRLIPTAPLGLIGVKALAHALGVSADFVYDHAAELGGVKVSDGPRAPWRFDLEGARARLAARAGSRESQPPASPAPSRSSAPRRRRARDTAARSLAIRGDEA